MKTLKLELNKRLLIVEYGTEAECAIEWALMHAFKNPNIINHGHKIKPSCSGLSITQSIIEAFVNKKSDDYGIYWYKDYTVIDEDLHDAYTFLNPKESFISAIESKGYHWGENPEGKSRPNFDDYSSLISYQGDCRDWDLAESRTLNPSKCLIFEIL